MAFIETISPSTAQGDVLEMYARQQERFGYVPNYAKVFSHRPQVMARWAMLLAAIRRPMTARRFELVTFAAAHALKNSYCALAHGEALTHFVEPEAVSAIANNEAEDVLSDTECAIVAFAKKIATNASGITSGDTQTLRSHGLNDDEIFDIAATAAARSFFAKLLDGLGVHPDSAFLELDESLRFPLTVGRPIANDPVDAITTGDYPGLNRLSRESEPTIAGEEPESCKAPCEPAYSSSDNDSLGQRRRPPTQSAAQRRSPALPVAAALQTAADMVEPVDSGGVVAHCP